MILNARHGHTQINKKMYTFTQIYTKLLFTPLSPLLCVFPSSRSCSLLNRAACDKWQRWVVLHVNAISHKAYRPKRVTKVKW